LLSSMILVPISTYKWYERGIWSVSLSQLLWKTCWIVVLDFHNWLEGALKTGHRGIAGRR
jgi:hypothetical protein